MEEEATECVVIEDADHDDQPGPIRSVHSPVDCSAEASWFDFSFKIPSDQVVKHETQKNLIEKFQDLIWHKPHDRMVPGYGMLPKELAIVSADGRRGWLVTSHFYWLMRMLNQQQKKTRCFVMDPGISMTAIEKSFNNTSRTMVERLVFVNSVGRQDDGLVYIGSDSCPGDHWSVAVVDAKTGEVFYCDTLGWPAPEKFLHYVVNYTKYLGFSKVSRLSLVMAHEPNDELHLCTENCTNYPLQTCSDICGVMAMVFIAVAALDVKLFKLLLKPLKQTVNIYLTNPTDYSSYLRHVIIYWLASSYIDISYISLKPDFNPFAMSNKVSTGKRKMSELSNGSASPSVKKICKKGPSVDEYILEGSASDVSFAEIVKEVSQLFGKDSDIEKAAEQSYRDFFSSLVFAQCCIRDKDEGLSTKSLISELMSLNHLSPIVLYKASGRESAYLNKDDTAIGLQTRYQREIMKTYGPKCVCVEVTRSSESLGRHLITVSVAVDGELEIPCAWLITNRNDNAVYSLFFKALKAKIGELKTEIFIGDMGYSLYKTWVNIFPKPEKNMFCTWEVLRAMQKKAESLISSEVNREAILRYLSVLPCIATRKAFDIHSKNILRVIKKESDEFHEYLSTKFIDESSNERWANCNRVLSPNNVVTFRRPFSSTWNIVCLGRGKIERFDVIAHKLLQLIGYIESKVLVQTSSVRTKNVCQDIALAHQKPMNNLDIFQSASGEEWYVAPSASHNGCCIIESDISDCKCQLVCSKCEICVHQLVCSCVNYLIQPSGCKHIHSIQTFRKMNSDLSNTLITNEPRLNTSAVNDSHSSENEKVNTNGL